MMASVVEKIYELAVEIGHRPCRGKSLCQHFDVEINKPLGKMRAQWENWIIMKGTTCPSSSFDNARWYVGHTI